MTTTGGQFAGRLRRIGAGPAQEVSLGEQPQFERVEDETPAGHRRRDFDEPLGGGVVHAVHPVARNPRVVEELGQPAGRTRPVGGHDHAPVVPDPGADELHHFGHVALVSARFTGLNIERINIQFDVLVLGQRRDRPPADLGGQGVGPGIGQGGEVPGIQNVTDPLGLEEIHGGCAAVGGGGPGSSQEFCIGFGEVVGAGSDPFGFHDHRNGICR